MTVETIWFIPYVCEHSEGRDLSAKSDDCAHWLASRDGTDWWRAARAGAGDRLTKQECPERKRSDEADSIAEWEKRAGTPPLGWSETAVGWGRSARHATLTGGCDTHLAEGGLGDEPWFAAIKNQARLFTGASRWIDNRDAAADAVTELVEAMPGAVAGVTENQFA